MATSVMLIVAAAIVVVLLVVVRPSCFTSYTAAGEWVVCRNMKFAYDDMMPQSRDTSHCYVPVSSRVAYGEGTVVKGKGKVGRAPPERRRGAHLPFKAIEPVGG